MSDRIKTIDMPSSPDKENLNVVRKLRETPTFESLFTELESSKRGLGSLLIQYCELGLKEGKTE
jgi:hypothetical protein